MSVCLSVCLFSHKTGEKSQHVRKLVSVEIQSLRNFLFFCSPPLQKFYVLLIIIIYSSREFLNYKVHKKYIYLCHTCIPLICCCSSHIYTRNMFWKPILQKTL